MGINVLSLFDGMSCGQIALERLGVEVDNYYACEIDKYAIKVTQANFPNTVQLGSVVDLDVSQLPQIDLLIGGSPCFVGGTLILTKEGYKFIEEVKVGDEVLTHANRWRKVLKIGGCLKETVHIVSQGFKVTTTTANHPFYTRKMHRKWDNELRSNYRFFEEPKWKEAGELKNDDFLCLPSIQEEHNPRDLDADTCWLLGRYLADGHYRKDKRKGRKNSYQYQLIISVGKNKNERFKARMKNFKFSFYPHSHSTYRACFSNMHLVNLVIDLGIGKGAKNKQLTSEILQLPRKLLAQVLLGYLSGDGCYTNGRWSANTVSNKLAHGLVLAIQKVFGVRANIFYDVPSDTTIIEGRTVKQSPLYTLKFSPKTNKQDNSAKIDGSFWTRFMRSIPTGIVEPVYNLEVEEDNSYTANNIVVHNCQSLSFAGKQQGVGVPTLVEYLKLKGENFKFEGQSYLFWEYIRIREELMQNNPDLVWLLENVQMKKEFKQIFDEVAGGSCITINSALVSAQNRVRSYWTNINNVTQPEDKNILLKDIIETGVVDRGKSYCIDANYFKGGNLKQYFDKKRRQVVFQPLGDLPLDPTGGDKIKSLPNGIFPLQQGKSRKFGNCVGLNDKGFTLRATQPNGVGFKTDEEVCYRKLTPEECEKLQTVPVGYTDHVSNTQRYRMLGNGWTVDVVAHILGFKFSK